MEEKALGHKIVFMRRQYRCGVRGLRGGGGLLSGLVVLCQWEWARVVSVGLWGGFGVWSGTMGRHDGMGVWSGGGSGATGLR